MKVYYIHCIHLTLNAMHFGFKKKERGEELHKEKKKSKITVFLILPKKRSAFEKHTFAIAFNFYLITVIFLRVTFLEKKEKNWVYVYFMLCIYFCKSEIN